MSVNQFVEKLLGVDLNNQKDPGLAQGAEFNTLQNIIIKKTLPELPLMEETSMPGLGSIVESLSNQDSTETPLELTDQKEFKALKNLEKEFNQKLTEYVAAYKATMESAANSNTPSDIAKNLSRLNDELLDISNRMWEQIQDLHTADARLQKTITQKRHVLRNQMQQLQGYQQQHQKVSDIHNTLNASVEDHQLQLNAAYLQYLVWFFAASTVLAVGLHQMSKTN